MANLYKTSKTKSDVVPQSRGNDKFYHTAVWRKMRMVVLNEEPNCRVCFENGRINESTEVDHIKPIRLGGAKLDRNNLQGLCKSCHARKSSLESKNSMKYGT